MELMMIPRPGPVPGTKTTTVMKFVNDIATIANALDGKVEFSHIEFYQCLMSEEYREKNVNNIVFVKKAYGVWFYTTRCALDDLVMLKGCEMPVLVGCENSNKLYRIRK